MSYEDNYDQTARWDAESVREAEQRTQHRSTRSNAERQKLKKKGQRRRFTLWLAFVLIKMCIRDSPTVVSLLLSLESFFAVVCGAIVLHERMSLREYFGCALMLAAVILSQLPEKSAKAVESGKKE